MNKEIQVMRSKWKDKASSSHVCFQDKIRLFKLFNKRIQHGRNCIIKPHAEITLTDNAILEIGNNVILESYSFLLLTKPNPHLKLGDWVSIGRYSIIAVKGNTVIGNYTQIGPQCQIIDHDHSFLKEDLIINQPASIKGVTIGSDCWLGSGVKVLKGVTIGDGAVVGANSVVTNDIPAYEIWAGAPAKFIKKRV